MNQSINATHKLDAAGNPTGGVTTGLGFAIEWQDGPLVVINPDEGPVEQNGAFVEGVLNAALERLQFFQSFERFACRENALAITSIEDALRALAARTARRANEGVLGTHRA